VDILGLGMSMIDLLQVVDEFPSVPGVTESNDCKLMGGGPVPTALCAAAKLGTKCGIIDRVGADWRGERIRQEYQDFGVDTSSLLLEKGKTSSFGSALVRKSDGERHIIFSEGDFTPINSNELPLRSLKATKILHLNGRHWPACINAAEIVGEAGGKVSFDGGANRYQEKFQEILPLVDILIVARDFAERLSKSTGRKKQMDILSQWGAEIVGITDGVNGSRFREMGGSEFSQSAFPIESIIDTTGCGDVFHGAFLSEYVRGSDTKQCARFASAAAAWNATALGGRGKLPVRDDVEKLRDQEL